MASLKVRKTPDCRTRDVEIPSLPENESISVKKDLKNSIGILKKSNVTFDDLSYELRKLIFKNIDACEDSIKFADKIKLSLRDYKAYIEAAINLHGNKFTFTSEYLVDCLIKSEEKPLLVSDILEILADDDFYFPVVNEVTSSIKKYASCISSSNSNEASGVNHNDKISDVESGIGSLSIKNGCTEEHFFNFNVHPEEQNYAVPTADDQDDDKDRIQNLSARTMEYPRQVSVMIIYTKSSFESARNMQKRLEMYMNVVLYGKLETTDHMYPIEFESHLLENIDIFIPLLCMDYFADIRPPLNQEETFDRSQESNKLRRFHSRMEKEFAVNSAYNFKVRPVLVPGFKFGQMEIRYQTSIYFLPAKYETIMDDPLSFYEQFFIQKERYEEFKTSN